MPAAPPPNRTLVPALAAARSSGRHCPCRWRCGRPHVGGRISFHRQSPPLMALETDIIAAAVVVVTQICTLCSKAIEKSKSHQGTRCWSCKKKNHLHVTVHWRLQACCHLLVIIMLCTINKEKPTKLLSLLPSRSPAFPQPFRFSPAFPQSFPSFPQPVSLKEIPREIDGRSASPQPFPLPLSSFLRFSKIHIFPD